MKNMTQRRLDKELNRIRREFRTKCHAQLDEYLDQEDEETSLPIINTLIAYMGQDWGIAVGIKVTEPEGQTEIEQKAIKSGIEIVRA